MDSTMASPTTNESTKVLNTTPSYTTHAPPPPTTLNKTSHPVSRTETDNTADLIKEMRIGIIAGFGTLVVLLLALAAVFFIHRRRRTAISTTDTSATTWAYAHHSGSRHARDSENRPWDPDSVGRGLVTELDSSPDQCAACGNRDEFTYGVAGPYSQLRPSPAELFAKL